MNFPTFQEALQPLFDVRINEEYEEQMLHNETPNNIPVRFTNVPVDSGGRPLIDSQPFAYLEDLHVVDCVGIREPAYREGLDEQYYGTIGNPVTFQEYRANITTHRTGMYLSIGNALYFESLRKRGLTDEQVFEVIGGKDLSEAIGKTAAKYIGVESNACILASSQNVQKEGYVMMGLAYSRCTVTLEEVDMPEHASDTIKAWSKAWRLQAMFSWGVASIDIMKARVESYKHPVDRVVHALGRVIE